MEVSVCVASVRPGTLPGLFRSLRAQSFRDFEVIVVGQGSDQTVRAVVESTRESDPRFRYVHIPTRGLSFARNAAIKAAESPVIAMTDDDCEAHEDWLQVIVDAFKSKPEVGVFSGSLEAPHRPSSLFAECPQLSVAEVVYDPGQKQGVPAGWDIVGANFSFRKSLMETVGYFDGELGAGARFPAGEETDFKLRVERRAIPMWSSPRSIVYHTHGYRVGFGALAKQAFSYARGNGGLAGKLTLLGLPLGSEWLTSNRKLRLAGWKRPARFPLDLALLKEYETAYATCVREYQIASDGHSLERVNGSSRV